MANAFYVHASKPELVSGLRALKMYADMESSESNLGVLLGSYKTVTHARGKHHIEKRKIPDRRSNSQVIWSHRESRPYVHPDGKVRDVSIMTIRTKKGGTLRLLSAPMGDTSFLVHLETGIPEYWNLNKVAEFMLGLGTEDFKLHGSERIDDGSENVLAHRIRWQRPRTFITDTVNPVHPGNGIRVYSGDVWLMQPGSQVLAHDVCGNAFRVVCEDSGPKVVDPGTPKPYEKYLELVMAKRSRHAAADAAETEGVLADATEQPAAEPVQAKAVGWFGRG